MNLTEKGTYDTEKKRWKCNKCGTLCLNQQGLDLHWHYKHGEGAGGRGGGKPPTETRRPSTRRPAAAVDEDEGTCPDCGGALRLLSSKVARERQAIALGASVVCSKCDKLYKSA